MWFDIEFLVGSWIWIWNIATALLHMFLLFLFLHSPFWPVVVMTRSPIPTTCSMGNIWSKQQMLYVCWCVCVCVHAATHTHTYTHTMALGHTLIRWQMHTHNMQAAAAACAIGKLFLFQEGSRHLIETLRTAHPHTPLPHHTHIHTHTYTLTHTHTHTWGGLPDWKQIPKQFDTIWSGPSGSLFSAFFYWQRSVGLVSRLPTVYVCILRPPVYGPSARPWGGVWWVVWWIFKAMHPRCRTPRRGARWLESVCRTVFFHHYCPEKFVFSPASNQTNCLTLQCSIYYSSNL